MAGKSDGSNSSLRGAIATKQSTLVLSCGELDCFAGARNDGIRTSASRNPSPAVSEQDGYRFAPPILRAATGQDLGNGLICVGQISLSRAHAPAAFMSAFLPLGERMAILVRTRHQ